MRILALPPQVEAEGAEALFRRRLASVGRLDQLKRLVGLPLARRRLTSFELLYDPHWVVPYSVPSREGSMRGPIEGTLAIDAAEGLAAHLMAPLTDIVELDVDDDSTVDKINLNEAEAAVKAREAIRWNVFNRPYMVKQDVFGKEGDLRLEFGEVRLVYYPFWVAYFEAGAKMDLVVIEALTATSRVRASPTQSRATWPSGYYPAATRTAGRSEGGAGESDRDAGCLGRARDSERPFRWLTRFVPSARPSPPLPCRSQRQTVGP